MGNNSSSGCTVRKSSVAPSGWTPPGYLAYCLNSSWILLEYLACCLRPSWALSPQMILHMAVIAGRTFNGAFISIYNSSHRNLYPVQLTTEINYHSQKHMWDDQRGLGIQIICKMLISLTWGGSIQETGPSDMTITPGLWNKRQRQEDLLQANKDLVLSTRSKAPEVQTPEVDLWPPNSRRLHNHTVTWMCTKFKDQEEKEG